MKRISLFVCMMVISVVCLGMPVQSLALGEMSVSVPDGVYAGLECQIVAKPGLYDYRAPNTITLKITKDGKTVKNITEEFTFDEFNNGKIFTFKPAATGSYKITATDGKGNSDSVTVTAKAKSKLQSFYSWIGVKGTVFVGSTIDACFNFKEVKVLDSHKCKVKVQFKKGKKVVKTKTFTEPATTSSGFGDEHKLSFKASKEGTYKVVFTHYIDGKACYKNTQTVKVIKKKAITGIKPELFINFDQGAKKYTVFEDKVCNSGVYGYKIYRSTKAKSGYKCIKTVTKPNYEIYKGKLTSKKYYYKIKVMTKVGKKKYTSKFSNVVKTPAAAKAPVITKAEPDRWGCCTLTFKKAEGTTQYYCYIKKAGGKYADSPYVSDDNELICSVDYKAGTTQKYTFKTVRYIHKAHYNIYTKPAFKTVTITMQ